MKYEIELDDKDAELVVRWGEQTLSDIGRKIAKQIATQQPQPIIVGSIVKWRKIKANPACRMEVMAVDGRWLAVKRIDVTVLEPYRWWCHAADVERVSS